MKGQLNFIAGAGETYGGRCGIVTNESRPEAGKQEDANGRRRGGEAGYPASR